MKAKSLLLLVSAFGLGAAGTLVVKSRPSQSGAQPTDPVISNSAATPLPSLSAPTQSGTVTASPTQPGGSRLTANPSSQSARTVLSSNTYPISSSTAPLPPTLPTSGSPLTPSAVPEVLAPAAFPLAGNSAAAASNSLEKPGQTSSTSPLGSGSAAGTSSDNARASANTALPEVLEVPRGARVPVAFLDEGQELSSVQREALARIRDDFAQTVNQPPAAEETPEEVWQQAQQSANNRYRVLFGDAAANALEIQAAREALSEKQALNSAPSSP